MNFSVFKCFLPIFQVNFTPIFQQQTNNGVFLDKQQLKCMLVARLCCRPLLGRAGVQFTCLFPFPSQPVGQGFQMGIQESETNPPKWAREHQDLGFSGKKQKHVHMSWK